MVAAERYHLSSDKGVVPAKHYYLSGGTCGTCKCYHFAGDMQWYMLNPTICQVTKVVPAKHYHLSGDEGGTCKMLPFDNCYKQCLQNYHLTSDTSGAVS